MPTPGLLYATTKISDPSLLSPDDFNSWYSITHIPPLLSYKPGGPSLALRFKNVDPDAGWPYLALYPVPDKAVLGEERFWKEFSVGVPGSAGSAGKEMEDVVEWEVRCYEKIQTFEGQIAKQGRAKCIVAAAMTPAPSTHSDFESWYRLQHLDMLSTVPGYHRSTRYQLTRPSPSPIVAAADDATHAVPDYLALHEFDSEDIDREKLGLVVGTEWSRRVIGGARAFVRDVWVLVEGRGEEGGWL
ncbi:hypothetical protein K490DRAFT_62526 [Saccharata proteae CBS 121410]|uniref:Uncharacterized protein n=1 Tax=Saccharata proteae CBS 121410 TaxID=1314787 RepID=A0A9P4HXT0_9PEZI|nr:hypothetical protein K490DRAFT_62526 [Saccharata proteae CBS 121410]